MQFGKSSEKLDTQIAQLELTLEELEGEAIAAAARRGDPAAVDRSSPVRALPAHLPREEQRIEPEQGNCTCPDCGWDELMPWNWTADNQPASLAA